MEAYCNGTKVRLGPAVGKGGEADVYDIGSNRVLKLFKPPTHPDFRGFTSERRAAEERLVIQQQKLPALQRKAHMLPPRVVRPETLATNAAGNTILGYAMARVFPSEVLLRYSEKPFRQRGVGVDVIRAVFRDLHATVAALHTAGFVIGDFNDLNVLVRRDEAFLIDVDSFQFDRFLCTTFTDRFVDPLLIREKTLQEKSAGLGSLTLAKPFTPDSDWYAYAVMLLQCMLFVHPYDGIYRPSDAAKRLLHDARPLHRITIFHPDVRYPKPAIPYGVLPDTLLDYFHQTLVRDARGMFPLRLLEALEWATCPRCGTEHARAVCPQCAAAAAGRVKEVTRVRGNVVATRIVQTRGVILAATIIGGKPAWLIHEGGAYRRENGTVVLSGPLGPDVHVRLMPNATLFWSSNQLLTVAAGGNVETQSIDCVGNLPIFDANAERRFWIDRGELRRDGEFGPESVGEILSQQTLFWVGPLFGVGFYRAGTLSVVFVFDVDRHGMNDSVKLPNFRGQLVDATCVFTDSVAWLFASFEDVGKIINRCYRIRPDGSVDATAEAESGDGSWLSHIRGGCAAGNFLLVPTDDGLVRVEPDGQRLVVTQEFPDTEPFVDAGCQLLAGHDGVYVVGSREIRRLQIR